LFHNGFRIGSGLKPPLCAHLRPRQLRRAVTNIDAAELGSTAVLPIAGSMVALAGFGFVKYIRYGLAELTRKNNAIQ